MANLFKSSEVVGIAIRIEQGGFRFYSDIQKMIKDEKANEIFRYLAGEEKKHEALFSNMLDKIGQIDTPASMKEDYELYVQSIADSHIFRDDKSAAASALSIKGLHDALDMGMAFEKDSILFFREMLNYVPESRHKTIEILIEEEKKHLIKLAALK
jgi:rubrerythrin